jgi:WD40 repeat protein
VTFSPDGKTLASGDGGGRLVLWDTAARQVTATFAPPGARGGLLSSVPVAFAPDGKTILTGNDEGPAYLWDVATRKLAATITPADGSDAFSILSWVTFAPDGKTLAIVDEYSLTLWHITRT